MKKLFIKIPLAFVLLLSIQACRESKQSTDSEATEPAQKQIERIKPREVAYELVQPKQWLKEAARDSSALKIVYAINRTDHDNLIKIDSVLVPTDHSGDLAYYLPFPTHVKFLEQVDKIILFSYPAQVFAAYEKGELVATGPTNMGREKDKTPTGLFSTNWKAEKTTSTFNDEWDLKWNFNIQNKLGVGFHEYSLPGYPASHSCLRLQSKDAQFLYKWADEWILKDDENIEVEGTPVVVFGSYPFGQAKPWLALVKNPKVLDLTETDVEKEVKPFLSKILAIQKLRRTK